MVILIAILINIFYDQFLLLYRVMDFMVVFSTEVEATATSDLNG